MIAASAGCWFSPLLVVVVVVTLGNHDSRFAFAKQMPPVTWITIPGGQQGSEYVFMTNARVNYWTAREWCESARGHLVIIENKAERDAIKNHLAALAKNPKFVPFRWYWTNGIIANGNWLWGPKYTSATVDTKNLGCKDLQVDNEKKAISYNVDGSCLKSDKDVQKTAFICERNPKAYHPVKCAAARCDKKNQG